MIKPPAKAKNSPIVQARAVLTRVFGSSVLDTFPRTSTYGLSLMIRETSILTSLSVREYSAGSSFNVGSSRKRFATSMIVAG